MKPIGPGTLLRCVKSWTDGNLPEVRVTEGSLYLCEAVEQHPYQACPVDGCGFVGYLLQGKKYDCGYCSLTHEPMFCPHLFAPMDDGDTSLVESELEDKIKGLEISEVWWDELEDA